MFVGNRGSIIFSNVHPRLRSEWTITLIRMRNYSAEPVVSCVWITMSTLCRAASVLLLVAEGALLFIR